MSFMNSIVTSFLFLWGREKLSGPNNKINWILDAFNNFNTRFQFMLEVGGDRINFLDTTIILHNNKIKLDWYYKPTDLRRFLNYCSQHPISQKRHHFESR